MNVFGPLHRVAKTYLGRVILLGAPPLHWIVLSRESLLCSETSRPKNSQRESRRASHDADDGIHRMEDGNTSMEKGNLSG